MTIKRRIISGIIYATAALCLGSFLDFYFGATPSGLHISFWDAVFLICTVLGTLLFGVASVLSFFNLQGTIASALVAALLLLPFLFLQLGGFPWGGLTWFVSYRPETAAAIFSLVVSGIYSIHQLRLFLRSGTSLPETTRLNWKLYVAILYSAATLGTAVWRDLWDYLFKLRYGN